MDLSVIVTLMGGLGLFLLGMHQMGDGMEKAAGARMRNILEAVTSNRIRYSQERIQRLQTSYQPYQS